MIDFYCDYCLINRTGLPLFYRQVRPALILVFFHNITYSLKCDKTGKTIPVAGQDDEDTALAIFRSFEEPTNSPNIDLQDQQGFFSPVQPPPLMLALTNKKNLLSVKVANSKWSKVRI